MVTTAFLASKYLSGLAQVLPDAPERVRVVFVPTAGSCFPDAAWIDRERSWFTSNGFPVRDLELVDASPSSVDAALRAADLVYVAGGNTYFLLYHMQQTRFWDAISNTGIIYVGVSAGAIVAGPDIAHIADLDDRALAPGLTDTTGAGIVKDRILPHYDDGRYRPTIDRILGAWPYHTPATTLDDDQAIVVHNGVAGLAASPKGSL